MRKILMVATSISLLFISCNKEEFLNARIAGTYDCFVKKQTEVWFQPLALNYTDNDEIDGYAIWDGIGNSELIRIEIDKKTRKKINFTIPEQFYETGKTIIGDGVLIGNTIEFYYIIGNENLSKSYILSGNK